jgi:hypothetical protein
LAAQAAGRRCRAIEIDGPYCDLIIRRWEAATGREAALEATDETYDEVAALRQSPGEEGGEASLDDDPNSAVATDRDGDANWGERDHDRE